MYTRILEPKASHLDDEYSEKYPLYNVLVEVTNKYESRYGGLMPVDVMTEVLRIEKELANAKRPDKKVSTIRTQLESLYRQISVTGREKTLPPRSDAEVERSAILVLMILSMRLASWPDSENNPYQRIIDTITNLAAGCRDKVTVYNMANELNLAEDKEELFGYPVPEEDVLKPWRKPVLDSREKTELERLKPVLNYFLGVLLEGEDQSEALDGCLTAVFDDILHNERLLSALGEPTSTRFKNTIGEKDKELKPDEADYAAAGYGYNIKLVLAIIGTLIEHGVIRKSCDVIAESLFTDNKSKYFKPSAFKKFGQSDSGYADAEMYSTVCSIIQRHRSLLGTSG